jgi:hypothetical protein
MRAFFLTALLLVISLPLYAADNEPLHKSTPTINQGSDVVKALPDTPTTTESMPEKVYKWVDDNGLTHYGDQPPSQDIAPVDLPAIQILDSVEVETQQSPTPDAAPITSTTPPIPDYQLNITAPKNDETLAMSDAGTVFIALSINVPLLEGHRVSMSVDGKEIALNSSGAVNIAVRQGRHTVQASIVDTDNNVLAQSSMVKFKAIDTLGYNQLNTQKIPVNKPDSPIINQPIEIPKILRSN